MYRLICLLFLLAAAPVFAHKVTAVSGLTDLETKEGTYRVELKMEVQPTGDPNIDDQISPEQAAQTFAEEVVVIYFDDSEQKPKIDTRVESMSDDQTPVELQRKAVFVGLSGKIPEGAGAFMLYVRETTDVSVIMLIRKDGKAERRFQVLYPGDFGRPVALEESGETAPEAGETESGEEAAEAGPIDWVKTGFLIVLPDGTIHWIFAVSLLLLTLKLRPVIRQVAVFVVAHSLGLALVAFQVVDVALESSIVMMGLGIAYVGVETMMTENLKPWRLPALGVFGLFHGFALGKSPSFEAMLVAAGEDLAPTIGAGIGIELAFVVVWVAGLFVLRILTRQDWFRKQFVQPACAILTGAGLYWSISPFL
ncbi:MAG: hypothetical protein HKN23_02185 [Verrucomicrobiales bacterium]|nr:hypothetical protein [Verrucomicrobiales bacterium]